jgi:hypothetical protein
MENTGKQSFKAYCIRFGKIAVEFGFITEEQLKDALTEQIEDDISNRRHRLIGEIMFMNGWINIKQLEIVLNKLYKDVEKGKRDYQKHLTNT